MSVWFSSPYFKFSPSRITKTALVKSFYEKSKASFKKENHDKCVFWNIKTIS